MTAPQRELSAFVGNAFLGTDRVGGRPLTNEEKARLGKMLRAHDYVGARLVALRFAFKLRRNRAAAEDVMGRADVRLMKQGWDPGRVPLVKCLCRYVWSEATHAKQEEAAARRAEQAFVHGQGEGGRATSSAEQRNLEHAKRLRDEERAEARIAKMRAAFEAAGDEVNLLWLEYSLGSEDKVSPEEMARRSGRPVGEFYRATDRRTRLVRRLLSEEQGLHFEEDET